MTPFINRLSPNDQEESALSKVPSFVWKRFEDGHVLHMRFFAPPNHAPDRQAPSVMFFHGGMWTLNYEEEFFSWATHLSSCGVACFIPEYRTHASYEVSAEEIMHEGVEAFHWLYHNTAELGLDPRRITLAGTDAGGLMALYASMQPLKRRPWWRFYFSRDDLPISPASVAIFRGIVDVEAPEARLLRVGIESPDPEAINPCALLRKHLPPLFCAHGMLDPLLDYEMREWFCEEWRSLGNKAELLLCPQGDHTLTQLKVNPVVFEQVLMAWSTFMVDLSLWPEEAVAEPTLI